MTDQSVCTEAGELISTAVSKLTAVGIELPQLEARILRGSVMQIPPSQFIVSPEIKCSDEEKLKYIALVERRKQYEPVSHLTGFREFWSLNYQITNSVLDPRPDSETLVFEALKSFPERKLPLRVLDIGVGSGCLLLSFLSERPNAVGIGVDISLSALKIAHQNAVSFELSNRAVFQQSNWLDGVAGEYDVIFCNPPYVSSEEFKLLHDDVRKFEPREALLAGVDGLEAYKNILPHISKFLSKDGEAFFEVGINQAQRVSEISEANGLIVRGQFADISGIPRCLAIKKH